jgi:hypothetical protein
VLDSDRLFAVRLRVLFASVQVKETVCILILLLEGSGLRHHVITVLVTRCWENRFINRGVAGSGIV